jgi:hypothetical protein
MHGTGAAAIVAAVLQNRKERGVSIPPADEAELNATLIRSGLTLAPEEVKAILPGVAIVQGMIARVNAPLPREAEPALTFNAEQK